MIDLLTIPFLAPIIVSAVVIVGSGLYYRKKPKVDKGWAFPYYKLTYRRRYKRTLIVTVPLIVLLSIVMYFLPNIPVIFKVALIIFAIISTVIQIIYNYRMWQKKEANTVD